MTHSPCLLHGVSSAHSSVSPRHSSEELKTFRAKSHPAQQQTALSLNLHILCSSFQDTTGTIRPYGEPTCNPRCPWTALTSRHCLWHVQSLSSSWLSCHPGCTDEGCSHRAWGRGPRQTQRRQTVIWTKGQWASDRGCKGKGRFRKHRHLLVFPLSLGRDRPPCQARQG